MTPQERTAWLEWRRHGIGSSDLGALLGVSPWGGPWGVWMSKRYPPEERDSPEMATGRRLERAVGEWASDELGAAELIQGEPKTHPTSHVRVTPDFWLRFNDRDDTGLEVKVCDRFDEAKGWGADGSGQVPPHYDAQVRACMAVFDVGAWILAAFARVTNQWRTFVVLRDLDWERETLAMVDAWWVKHIVNGEPPDIDASTACTQALARIHPRHTSTLRVASEGEEGAVRLLAEVSAKTAEMAEHKRQLENHLRDLIGDAEGIRFAGGYARWGRPSNRLTWRLR